MAKLEQKIFLDKNDDLDKAVGELVAATADKIILNIPKNSVLGASVHNFQILERESETAGKELAIESVDEHILELASLATIPAVNPVFRVKERAVADILPGVSEEEEEKPVKKPRARKTKAKPADADEESPVIIVEKPKRKATSRKKKTATGADIPITIVKKEKPAVPETIERFTPREEPEPIVEEKFEEPEAEYLPDIKEEKPRPARKKRTVRFWATAASALVVVLAAGYFAVTDFLPRATINISIQKTSASFSDSVIVDTSSTAPSVNGNAVNLPGQLTIAKSNLSMSFPATGSSTVSMKAGGTLTVYNNYNTQSQILVATTRFESPEGKIFRLVSRATVPGMKGTTPGSVEVQVVADQPGPDYNVPPSQNWQIPGFKGTARYGKFYAEAKSSMTGGSSGNQMIPTKDDIAQAKAKIESALADSLKSQTLVLNSENLKLLGNAAAFNITTENISSQADQDGNFSIFAAGELKQLVFDESMLKSAIVGAIATSTADVKIDDMTLDYATSTADLENGRIAFSVSGALTYEPKIDFDGFKSKILGLDASTLKSAIFALPGLQNANISFWPFWVNSVPTRPSQVNMVVE